MRRSWLGSNGVNLEIARADQDTAHLSVSRAGSGAAPSNLVLDWRRARDIRDFLTDLAITLVEPDYSERRDEVHFSLDMFMTRELIDHGTLGQREMLKRMAADQAQRF